MWSNEKDWLGVDRILTTSATALHHMERGESERIIRFLLRLPTSQLFPNFRLVTFVS